MPLPIALSKPVAKLSDHKMILIFGTSKVGKSTFASTFPDPIFFDFERGLAGLAVYSVTVDHPDDARSAFKELKGDEGKRFKTVVIDSIDFAFELFKQEITTQHKTPLLRKVEGGFGAGQEILRNKMRNFIISLKQLPQQIVLLCHADTKAIQQRNGESYSVQSLAIDDKKLHSYLLAEASIVLYMEREKTEAGEEFRLLTSPQGVCEGVGSRAKFTGFPIVSIAPTVLTYQMLLADFETANKEKK